MNFFSPQRIPDIAPHLKQDLVTQAKSDSPLNWELEHPLANRPLNEGLTWKHHVYCGLFNLEAMRLELEKIFGADNHDFSERSDGTSCTFTFSLTQEGRPLFESIVVSSVRLL